MDATEDLRVVVVGSGRVGLRTAQMLHDRGHETVIVERHPDRVAEAVDAYIGTIIEGDAARPSVLEQADLQRADVLAAMTDTVATNLAVCMVAKQVEPEIRTVLRSVHGHPDEFEPYVDTVVEPEHAGARLAVNAIVADVSSLEPLTGDLEILEVTVAEDAPAAGRSLAEVALPEGSLIISGADEDRIADAETRLEPGRAYLVATEPRVADEVLRLLRG